MLRECCPVTLWSSLSAVLPSSGLVVSARRVCCTRWSQGTFELTLARIEDNQQVLHDVRAAHHPNQEGIAASWVPSRDSPAPSVYDNELSLRPYWRSNTTNVTVSVGDCVGDNVGDAVGAAVGLPVDCEVGAPSEMQLEMPSERPSKKLSALWSEMSLRWRLRWRRRRRSGRAAVGVSVGCTIQSNNLRNNSSAAPSLSLRRSR